LKPDPESEETRIRGRNRTLPVHLTETPQPKDETLENSRWSEPADTRPQNASPSEVDVGLFTPHQHYTTPSASPQLIFVHPIEQTAKLPTPFGVLESVFRRPSTMPNQIFPFQSLAKNHPSIPTPIHIILSVSSLPDSHKPHLWIPLNLSFREAYIVV